MYRSPVPTIEPTIRAVLQQQGHQQQATSTAKRESACLRLDKELQGTLDRRMTIEVAVLQCKRVTGLPLDQTLGYGAQMLVNQVRDLTVACLRME